MQNYAMEFKKFSAREVKSTYPITAIKMHKPLCQDILFNLSSRFTEIDSYKFSSAFFYDFYQIRENVNWESVFVLDGVEYLHRFSGTDKPLVRDRALYSFLYLNEDHNSAFAEAIITNPWLIKLCDRPLRLLSERVSVVENTIAYVASSRIYSAILEDLDSGFTPRGVWGLDYMFMWKASIQDPKVQINSDIKLIPLYEYVNSFKEVN